MTDPDLPPITKRSWEWSPSEAAAMAALTAKHHRLFQPARHVIEVRGNGSYTDEATTQAFIAASKAFGHDDYVVVQEQREGRPNGVEVTLTVQATHPEAPAR